MNIPGSGSKPRVTAADSAASTTVAQPDNNRSQTTCSEVPGSAVPLQKDHGLGAQVRGDAHGTQQQVDPALGSFGGHHRRLVFAPGIQHVPAAGLDDDGETEPLQPPRQPSQAVRQVVGERVELTWIESQSDALVAQIREHGQGVFQGVIAEAVGAVSEPCRGRRAGSALLGDRHTAAPAERAHAARVAY